MLAANWAMIWHSMWRTTAGSHLRDFFSPLLRKRHTCEPLHNASGHGKFSRNDSGRRIDANRSMTLQKINSSKIVCCLKAIACLFACFGVWIHDPIVRSPRAILAFKLTRWARNALLKNGRMPAKAVVSLAGPRRELEPAERPSA